MTRPLNINPVQWQQAIGLARAGCARVFRDGGSPGDAMARFGLKASGRHHDWDRAIEAIARALCASRH
jgi:hypothetical protein